MKWQVKITRKKGVLRVIERQTFNNYKLASDYIERGTSEEHEEITPKQIEKITLKKIKFT